MKRLLRQSWRLALTSFVLVGVLGLGTVGGVVLDRQVLTAYAGPDATATKPTSDLPLVQQAYDTIQREYVDRTALQPQRLEYGAISGMADSLGDTGHSRFLSPQMVTQERELTQGQFEGIGAEVQVKDGAIVVVAPIDGTPAQQAGLRPGDVMLLATEEWLTPAGRVIWHHGIAPDMVTALPKDAIPLLPEAERGMTAAQLRASGDVQLLRALDLLNQPSKSAQAK